MLTWYFAYGSNMETATFCGRRGIQCYRALPGRASGWQVVFDKPPLLSVGEGFANLIVAPTDAAHGVAYEIDESDLAHLDLTEGVLVGNYRRIEIEVEAYDAGQVLRLQVQTLISERRNPELRPSHRYMKLVIAGAREHGLPADYIAMLEAVPSKPESAEAASLRPLLDRLMKRGTP